MEGSKKQRVWTRKLLLATFSVLYLSFSIIFGISLTTWNDEIPGRCYNTRLIANPADSHPYVDRIYLGITCWYCLSILGVCVSASTKIIYERQATYYEFLVVHYALIQYPLHLYMVVAMRASNEGKVGNNSENEWGFGQVVALVLASNTVLECIHGITGK